MTVFFLFGSLRHAALLDRVLGRACAPLTRPARLDGEHPVLAGPRGPATLAEGPGSVKGADGLLLDGLTDIEVERLHFYTGVYGARPASRRVGNVDATVFLAPPAAPRQDYVFDDWEAAWAPLACIAADEIMAQFGRWSGGEFGAHRLKAVETRAAARLRAPERARTSRYDLDRDVVEQARHLPYLNFFSLAEIDFQHRRFDGSLSPVMNRATLKVGDAAIVLPYDPVRDCVLLVQQFRAAPYIAGDTAPWIWEAPAGLVDAGETPEQAACREAQEEAKITLSRLEPVTRAYSSTGSSTEFSHIFIGIADLNGAGAVAGLESEGEDIRSEVLPYDQFQADLRAGRFVNLQLVTAGFWLALNRDRLRKAG
ncbi:ADP-ribose pyrophosphatase [Marinibacterium anthonyi]|nr:ADP-ribose pyrophosphatase [Marinibacterium anthonyi]